MGNYLIDRYQKELEGYNQQGALNEGTVRRAFETLLKDYAKGEDVDLLTEINYELPSGKSVTPDGVLRDAFRQDWGYWEAKDAKDDLDTEIANKIAKGYPTDNIIYENTEEAVLLQGGQEVMRVSMRDSKELDRLLDRFLSYERPEIKEFRQALDAFKEELPNILDALRDMIEREARENAEFQEKRKEFLLLCREAIDENLQPEDLREMIIQHILTDELFTAVFLFVGDAFHKENTVAIKLEEVAKTFFTGKTRQNTLKRIEPFYAAIRNHAAAVQDHHEKQKFLNVLYETFYKAYNPAAADTLGVVYTPSEIVRFMIRSTDQLLHRHFGKGLAAENVHILDPCTGTGTFITELIEHLPAAHLPDKYAHEIHANEVGLLPYYIASLNIEATYRQKTEEYEPFGNIVFIDTLENMGFGYKGKNLELHGLTEENSARIRRQNKQRISVVIGNPPYNANQMNENDNNKNKEYSRVDKRIKDTYVNASSAQKTKVYDMYSRFYRWASDRVDDNGIVAFITNRSFINSTTFDGFRKVIQEEFEAIYVIDLGGDIRTLSGLDGIFLNEDHTIFGQSAAVGIAIMFLVKTKTDANHKIYYTHPTDIRATRKEKFSWLATYQNRFGEIQFQEIFPNKLHQWINQGEADFEELIPVCNKGTKTTKKEVEEHAVFKLYSLGVLSARDSWVTDFSEKTLHDKIQYFLHEYNKIVEKIGGKFKWKEILNNYDSNIKLTRHLLKSISKNKKLEKINFSTITSYYRPYVKKRFFFDRDLNEMINQNHRIFGEDGNLSNTVIGFSGTSSSKPFHAIATNIIPDYHLTGDSQCLPRYRYLDDGTRVDNITNWGLQQFQAAYPEESITKDDIFHYTYAVLHDPAYRERYKLNLKREFPRLPFYPAFHDWAATGKALMELHLGFEAAEPYALERYDDPNRDPESTPKPRLRFRKSDLSVIELDEQTVLRGVPPEAHEYKLGNRAALAWVLDQYKEKKPSDPTVAKHFNTYRFADYKETVIVLLKRVCTVSVETVRLVESLRQLPHDEEA